MVLSVITRKGTSLGMTFLELSKTSEKISLALKEGE
jgi:uncharacterized protein YheU (UPF0270 family)